MDAVDVENPKERYFVVRSPWRTDSKKKEEEDEVAEKKEARLETAIKRTW